MCGRATLITPVEEIAEQLGALPIDIGPPRYNLAPTQPMLIVRVPRARVDGDRARELALVRWGLIPRWAKPDEAKRVGSRCVQARLETLARAPAFRDAFASRRCLVVIDGFFEWKSLESGERKPHHVRRADGRPFTVAGVWESWMSPEGDTVESCAVVTTAAQGVVRSIHDRMPLVVPAEQRDAWLAGSREDAAELVAHAGEAAAEEARKLVALPLSKRVNNVKHDDPAVLAPEMPEAAQAELGQVSLRFS